MNRYVVKHVTIWKQDWTDVPDIQVDKYQKQPELPVRVTAQLCWTDDALHLRMCATEPEIRASYIGDNDPVYEDSCLEMFLSPCFDDGRYCMLIVQLSSNKVRFYRRKLAQSYTDIILFDERCRYAEDEEKAPFENN